MISAAFGSFTPEQLQLGRRRWKSYFVGTQLGMSAKATV